jgi:hypothetical protein
MAGMNAAIAFYIAHEASTDAPPSLPRTRAPRERSSRLRRRSAVLAAAVVVFTGSIGGIAFATSGEDPSPGAAEAASGTSGSDSPDPRPGRAGPGYVVD